ncbi:peptidoglycan-binding domain-containing protein [Streptomyces sp. NPDC050803]|uniref:peptidoglycan-binding domain-containing protein n=1 Tax=unclassified Streptomyces TaxID=2593676 RepID=UPI0034281F4A
MRKAMRRGTQLAAVGLGAAMALTAALAVPAHAANSGVYGTTFVDGDSTVTDDFGDHFNELGHSLCDGCPTSGTETELTKLWQNILWADGYLFDTRDGFFGPRTAAATKEWQADHGLTADGKVGDDTWSKADNQLAWGYENRFVVYAGEYRDYMLIFSRGNSESTQTQDGGAYKFETVRSYGSGADVTYIYGERIDFYK